MVSPLVHKNLSLPTDALDKEANEHLKRYPIYDFIERFNQAARQLGVWNADQEFGFLSIADRLRALETRPDIRAVILHEVTGIRSALATSIPITMQTDLLNSALNNGLVSTEKLLVIFNTLASTVYFDIGIFWRLWKSQSVQPEKEKLLKRFYTDLLAIAFDLGWHWEIRMALSRAWHMYVPIELREQIDVMRLEQERKNPRQAFTARQELEIATPQIIMQDMPLADFEPVLAIIEHKIGLDDDGGINENLLDDFKLPGGAAAEEPQTVKDVADEDHSPKG